MDELRHQLNNLLTVILGYGEELAEELPPGSPAAVSARAIVEAAQRAVELVSELPPKASVPAAAPEGRETILLVEDEAILRRLIERQLASLGYRVVPADGPAAALAALDPGKLEPDLVLTDVVMPGGGGVELVERLRRLRPALRAVVISGHGEVAVPAGSGAPPGFLQKPFTVVALARAVRAALDAPR